MTVMVIGASGLIGRALVPLLVRKDEVRVCVRRPEAADPLRAMGAKVAVGRFDDADALAEILKRVYTVVHLVGGPNQADDDAVLAANHGSVVTALAASREAGVRRFVLVSATGAAVDASNRYLRAKGLAEEAVANSGLEHAIVRSTHAYGVGGLWLAATVAAATASPPFVVGDGSQPLAPVFAGDVAAVVAAADDTGRASRGHLGAGGTRRRDHVRARHPPGRPRGPRCGVTRRRVRRRRASPKGSARPSRRRPPSCTRCRPGRTRPTRPRRSASI